MSFWNWNWPAGPRSRIAPALDDEPVNHDRAPLLAAQVEITLTLDHLDAARAALAGLHHIAGALSGRRCSLL